MHIAGGSVDAFDSGFSAKNSLPFRWETDKAAGGVIEADVGNVVELVRG
jgi:hypothetical protein